MNEKLLKTLMFIYPLYTFVLSYILFTVAPNNMWTSFITYFVIVGASPFLVYVAKWFFKGILQIDKFSKKTIVIFLYAISSFVSLFLVLMHFMEKYKLLDK